MPRPGEKVTIQATHGRVQAGRTAFGIFLNAAAPLEVSWSSWWWERQRRGDIQIVEPAPVAVTPPPSE